MPISREEFEKEFISVYSRFINFTRGELKFRGLDQSAAVDIVHTAYVNAVEKCEQIRDDTKLRSWMWRICRNLIVDYLRKRKASISRDDDVQLEYVVSPEADESSMKEVAEEFAYCLGQLSRDERVVIQKSFLEEQEWNQDEIGELMTTKSSQSSVSRLKTKALERLKKFLSR